MVKLHFSVIQALAVPFLIARIHHSKVADILEFTGHPWEFQLSAAAWGSCTQSPAASCHFEALVSKVELVERRECFWLGPETFPLKRCAEVGIGSNRIIGKCFIEEPGEPCQSLPLPVSEDSPQRRGSFEFYIGSEYAVQHSQWVGSFNELIIASCDIIIYVNYNWI